MTRTLTRARADSRCLPVHGRIALQPVQQLMGDDAKMVVPHHLDRAPVLGKGVPGTLEQTAESLARTRLWGLDCAAEVKIWRRPL